MKKSFRTIIRTFWGIAEEELASMEKSNKDDVGNEWLEMFDSSLWDLINGNPFVSPEYTQATTCIGGIVTR